MGNYLSICLHCSVQKAENHSIVFKYLQSSTDTEGKTIITDIILQSEMERDQEYIGKQHYFTRSFLAPDKKRQKNTVD